MFKEQPLKQDWTQDLPKYYFDNSPFKTHFLSGLSVIFPLGEKFFIDSVKNYQDKIIDADRKEELLTFIKQENWHSYAHQKYNLWVASHGLPAEYLEQLTFKKLERVKQKINKRGWLCISVGSEHITSIMAEHLLKHPELLDTMHPHFRQLWTWHAIEELEHKSVAINTLNTAGGGNLRFVMILTTISFVSDIIRNTIILLHADKQLFKWKTLQDAISLLFNFKNGFVTKLVMPWFSFMKKDFHPDQIDHTPLMSKYSKI